MFAPSIPLPPTAQTAPELGWRRLVGTVPTARGAVSFQHPHVVFTVIHSPSNGSVYIHAYNERTGARLDRPCSHPQMAFARVLDWARQTDVLRATSLDMAQRKSNDPTESYPTPYWVLDRLLDVLPLAEGTWLEPAVGNGVLVKTALAHPRTGHRHEWYGCDFQDSNEARAVLGDQRFVVGDFLRTKRLDEVGRFRGVLTNPPFSRAEEFLNRSLAIADEVILLLRLDWLGSESRSWLLRGNMPDVFVVPDRPSFVKGKTDTSYYAWMRWKSRSPQPKGTVQVLSTTPAEERRWAARNGR